MNSDILTYIIAAIGIAIMFGVAFFYSPKKSPKH